MVTTERRVGHFLIKAALLLTSLLLAGHYFASRYKIGFDPQLTRCLPRHRYFLIDRQDKQMIPGKLYAFRAQRTAPLFPEGTWMVKRLAASPGDTVTITSGAFPIQVNQKTIANGLPLAAKLGYLPQHFCGTTRLAAGQYWLLGDSRESFDSRYWGVVNDEQIIGRAWALF